MSVNILRYNPSKMAKTNFEILLGYGEEIDVAYKEKEKKLKKLDELGFSEPVKRHAREDIVRAFYGKIEEIKRKPLYEEALKSARKKGAMKHKMYRAKKAYQKAKESYKAAQIDYRGYVEEETKVKNEIKDEVKDTKEQLYGDKEKILGYLKKNCIKVKENVEYMGYKGKNVYINLPKVKGKFEGFKFKYFVSDETMYKNHFERKPEIVDKSHSMKDVCKLLKAMNRYMQAMGIETDGDMDYENDLKYWKHFKIHNGYDESTQIPIPQYNFRMLIDKHMCKVGDCIKDIAGLYDGYWLKDENVDGHRSSRAEWDCHGCFCHFINCDFSDCSAKLFLRLS